LGVNKWGSSDWAVAGLDLTTVWYALRCIDAYGREAPVAREVRLGLITQGLVASDGSLTTAGTTALADLGGPFPAALLPKGRR